MRARWRGRENTRQSPFLISYVLPRGVHNSHHASPVSTVFILSFPRALIPIDHWGYHISHPRAPIPLLPAYRVGSGSPWHPWNILEAKVSRLHGLELSLPLSSFARILGWGSTTMRLLEVLWWCLVNKADGGPAQHARPFCSFSCWCHCLCSISSSFPFFIIVLLLAIRLEANNSVDHFQYDPSSSVLLFFNSKP
ncbi:UDP-glycosyltransferase related protein [Neurospora crassa]|nr:UDP-glycosyltransferase related protein [imported] - Neurospora crassa [Neurospora crassa]KHE84894.1 UDP-glycosyltransferase related protein [Neurospora crassa]